MTGVEQELEEEDLVDDYEDLYEEEEEDEEEDDDEDEEEMARSPAGRAGRGTAAGRSSAAGRGTTAAAANRRSPPPGADALVAGMANVQVVDHPPFQAFNFNASSISILAETQTMSATGRRNVIGTFVIPNCNETDVSVTVSADGWYAELSLRVPPMFLYLVDRFAQEMGANDPDAPLSKLA